MSDARYEYIKKHFPQLAWEVESDAQVLARNVGDVAFANYVRGVLDGLAVAASMFGMVDDAAAFVERAKEIALGGEVSA